MTEAIQLWSAATPNGWKVSIMIEELREAGISLPPIEVIPVDIMAGEQFGDPFSGLTQTKNSGPCPRRSPTHGELRHFAVSG